MSHEIIKNLTADEALEKLKSGNQIYMNSRTGSGDISPEKRLDTCRNGQQPYAIIITCSDSRVHLGVKLIVVMGHNHCGAVDAAINHDPDGYIKFITDEIRLAIGGETDEEEACRLNVRHSIAVIESSLAIHEEEEHGLKVIGALYRLEDGKVEYF